jgi:hypothetical protein
MDMLLERVTRCREGNLGEVFGTSQQHVIRAGKRLKDR